MSPFTSAGLLHPSLEISHLKRCSIAKRASQIYHLLTIVHGKVINPWSSPRRWPPQSSVSSIIRTGYGQRRRTKPRTRSRVKRYPPLSILCMRSFLILSFLSPGGTYSVPDVCSPPPDSHPPACDLRRARGRILGNFLLTSYTVDCGAFLR